MIKYFANIDTHILIPILRSGVSTRSQSRLASQLANSSSDMSLPDPRLVVAPHRRRQHTQQVPPPPPQREQVPCDANLLLRRYSPNHMRFMEDGEPVWQPDPIPQPTEHQVPTPCFVATEQITRDLWNRLKYMTSDIIIFFCSSVLCDIMLSSMLIPS